MIPCLYDAGETEYKTNGIGKLADCISCTVTEKRNDSYELKMEYPTDGIHASELVEENIVLAKPADGKASQPFRIYKVTSDLSGTMEIAARHISYQLSEITVSPVTVLTGTDDQVNEAFAGLKKNATTDCPFDFETDISSSAYFGILEPVTFRSALGGVDGSMLDTFGGEFEWDFYTVRLLKSRGADHGVRIVYGKNLVDFKQEKNVENVITGVHPYWKDSETGEVVELTERVVTLEKSDAPYERIGLLDCSSEFDEEPTQSQLRSYAQSYLSTTTTTEPNIDIDIDFAQLWQTPEYEDVVEAERVSLCDTVHVYVTRLGITVSTIVTETEYDVLLERYKSITLSNSPTSSRNSSLYLTVATTSQVKSLIAITDSSIRLSVSSIYATKATLENDYSTTVEVQSLISLTEENITLSFDKKLRDEYSTTSEIQSMIELSEEGIMLEFNKYSTTEEVQSMIKVSEDGIALTYTKNGEVRSQFALEDNSITISSGTITFNAGKLVVKGDNFTLDSSGNATFGGTLDAASGTFTKIYTGSHSSYSSTNNGFYAGTDGLSLGKYFQVSNTGAMTCTSGTFSGSLSAATGTFAGSLSAATGTFSGTLSAVTGTFTSIYTGSHSSYSSTNNGFYAGTDGLSLGKYFQVSNTGAMTCTSGTFSGSLSAATGTFAGSLSAATGTFEGTVTVTSGNYKAVLGSGSLTIYYSSTEMGRLRSVTYGSTSYHGFTINLTDGSYSGFSDNGTLDYLYNPSVLSSISDTVHYFAGTAKFASRTYFVNPVFVKDVELNEGSSGSLYVHSGIYATGDIKCAGTKSRAVNTENYGEVLLYAYETASPTFGDSGSGTVGEDGEVSIFFQPEFAETVDAGTDYQVFLTRTSEKEATWIQKEDGYFTVYGDPGASFDWMVSVHQRDYTMTRLESGDADSEETQMEFDDSIFRGDNTAETKVNNMVDEYEQEVDLL